MTQPKHQPDKSALKEAAEKVAQVERWREGSNPRAEAIGIYEAFKAGAHYQAPLSFHAGIEAAAEAGSKAAWMHFHLGSEDPATCKSQGHVCIRSDWSYADAVSAAIRALLDDKGET